jgi:hypothetical protein
MPTFVVALQHHIETVARERNNQKPHREISNRHRSVNNGRDILASSRHNS